MLTQMRRLTLLLAVTTLAGCSEYLDRVDTMSPQSGNALQTDKLTHMVDPWPAVSADRNIAFDGAVSQAAVARYRGGRVTQPRGLNDSGGGGGNNSAAPSANSAPLGPTVNAQSGPVK